MKKNFLNESNNSENFNQPNKGINHELIKKYQAKMDELNDQINEVKREVKKVKKDKIEKEQELQEALEDKEKLERKHQIELKRYKEKIQI